MRAFGLVSSRALAYIAYSVCVLAYLAYGVSVAASGCSLLEYYDVLALVLVVSIVISIGGPASGLPFVIHNHLQEFSFLQTNSLHLRGSPAPPFFILKPFVLSTRNPPKLPLTDSLGEICIRSGILENKTD